MWSGQAIRVHPTVVSAATECRSRTPLTAELRPWRSFHAASPSLEWRHSAKRSCSCSVSVLGDFCRFAFRTRSVEVGHSAKSCTVRVASRDTSHFDASLGVTGGARRSRRAEVGDWAVREIRRKPIACYVLQSAVPFISHGTATPIVGAWSSTRAAGRARFRP